MISLCGCDASIMKAETNSHNKKRIGKIKRVWQTEGGSREAFLWRDDGGCVVERARSAGRVSEEVRAANRLGIAANVGEHRPGAQIVRSIPEAAAEIETAGVRARWSIETSAVSRSRFVTVNIAPTMVFPSSKSFRRRQEVIAPSTNVRLHTGAVDGFGMNSTSAKLLARCFGFARSALTPCASGSRPGLRLGLHPGDRRIFRTRLPFERHTGVCSARSHPSGDWVSRRDGCAV